MGGFGIRSAMAFLGDQPENATKPHEENGGGAIPAAAHACLRAVRPPSKCARIKGVTRLLLLVPFYTIQINYMYYFAHDYNKPYKNSSLCHKIDFLFEMLSDFDV